MLCLHKSSEKIGLIELKFTVKMMKPLNKIFCMYVKPLSLSEGVFLFLNVTEMVDSKILVYL